MPQPAQPAGALTLLRQNAVLRLLWVAGLASNVAGMMQDTASSWILANSEGASPMLVTWLQAASSIPFFLFALPGGALADVVDRRRLLVVATGWRFLVAAALALAGIAGMLTPFVLIGATFAMSLGATFTLPTWQASYPEVVAREDVPAAMRLAGAVTNIGRGAAPALAGLLLGALSGSHVFVLNAVLMGISLALLLLWRRPVRKEVLPTERLVGAMKAALRYVWHAPEIGAVLVRNFAFAFCASAPIALVPLLARQRLQLSGAEFGVAMAAMGLGGMAVSVFVLPKICSRFRMGTVVAAATVLLAAATAAMALVRNAVEFCLALAGLGAAVMSALASLNIGAQLSVPDWIRGRASSVFLLVVQATFAVAALCWGAVAAQIGVPRALLSAAAGAVLSLVLGRLLPLPQTATMNLSSSHHWPAFQLVTTLRPDDGPVLVQIDYLVPPENARAFCAAMRALRRVRRRDGGLRWTLLDDLARPGHFRESFLVESWSEHLRQVEHATVDDAAVETYACSFLKYGETPRVRHFLVVPEATEAEARRT